MTKKKSEKQSEYLAVGEFDVGQVINIARASFLWTIQQKEPRVSLQLREEVLNTFPVTKLHIDAPVPSVAKQRWQRLIEGTIECQDIASFRKDFQGGLFDNDQPCFVFLKALFDWSKYWNLDADWFVLRALKTLNSWTKNKIFRESLQWSRLLYGMDDPENEPQPPKGFPAWNVLDESAKTYRLKVTNQARNRIIKDEILSQVEASHREHFIRKLDPVVKDYQDQVSQFYKALGYKPVNRHELLKHIEWTVAFQVSDMAGQIIKRRDRTWLVRIFLGRDGNGKRRYLNKTIHGTKKDADTYLSKTLTEISAGTFVESSPDTVEDYLKKCLRQPLSHVSGRIPIRSTKG